jgi:hypothetical protein
VVTEAWSPNASAVNVPFFEPERRAKVEAIYAVADKFPVHQMLGMHDLHRGVHVHGRAGQVIIFANPNYIRVLELLIKQGIGVSAVAIVGGPVLCCGRKTR